MSERPDHGPIFAGVTIGRPATGALINSGYATLADLPENLEELLKLHGMGHKAVRRLEAARSESSAT